MESVMSEIGNRFGLDGTQTWRLVENEYSIANVVCQDNLRYMRAQRDELADPIARAKMMSAQPPIIIEGRFKDQMEGSWEIER